MFNKPVYSAFATGELHGKLRRTRINTLIITGAETDICVLSTILSAIDLSSADESHDALLGLYGRQFDLQVDLAEADELLDILKI